MNWFDITFAILAGLGICFIVLVLVAGARVVSEWKYQRQRERQYADEWVRRHRANGDPSPFPVRRPRDGK